ncbi:MAG: DNA-directed RNA polymerase subunit A'' [Thermoplasmata archaeon]
MARKDTIDALKRRRVGARVAADLADAGYTLSSLKKATPEELEKYTTREAAISTLKKLGVKVEEKKVKTPKPVKKKAPVKKRAPARKASKRPPEVPSKIPPPTPWEKRVLKILKETGGEMPSSLVGEVAIRAKALRLKKNDLEKVVKRVRERYESHIIDANESCGIISAQSIGEPGTQMSLPYTEQVLVRDQGQFRIIPIGELVDGLIKRYPGRAEGATEWCDLPRGVSLEVPSLTQDGQIVWKAVRAASRHSHEGGLLRLRTRAGRTITATPNHSFVIRRRGTIVPVYGRELRPGTRIPVVRRWTVPESPVVELDEYLQRDAFWYGSELARARALGPSWRQGYGRDYVVPVAPDALGRHLYGRAKGQIEEGLVYTSPNQGRVALPERLPLDETLGWLIGAYLSEGWPARHYVNISNTHEAFLSRTRAIAQGMGIGVGEYDNDRGFARGHDLHLRSTILAALLRAACGAGSANKRVPDFAFAGSDAFLGALLRAYFEGDGNVTVTRGAIRASSNSKDLLDGIVLLLARFGILASKGRQGRQHTLSIPRRFAPTFRDAIGFESESKRGLLDRLCAARDTAYTYDALDMVSGFGSILTDLSQRLRLPTRYVNSFTRRQVIGRATLARHTRRFEKRARELKVDVEEDLARLRILLEEDVFWDEIVTVEDLEPSRKPVYDLSVPGLETFTTAEGVVTHNTMRTFHYAGVAEMNVTLGLPRLIEIVDARRVPSTPVMEVNLKAGKMDLKKVRKFASEIEMTHLEDIAEIETDILNSRIVVYPHEARMRSRGVTRKDMDRALKKLKKSSVSRVVDGKEKKVKAYVMESDQPSYRRLQRLLELVKGQKIKGVDGIRRAIIRRKGDEYVVYTEGSNLAAILQMPYVDATRSSSNNVTEIHEVLGIEAARNAIIKEASDTLGEQGLTVDIRHVMLVADMMTNDGDVKAIGRHGISGRKSSVLARAAFEITSHHLLKAAVTGEVDYLDGVAENVIVGQPVTLGTGAVNLVFSPPKSKGK